MKSAFLTLSSQNFSAHAFIFLFAFSPMNSVQKSSYLTRTSSPVPRYFMMTHDQTDTTHYRRRNMKRRIIIITEKCPYLIQCLVYNMIQRIWGRKH